MHRGNTIVEVLIAVGILGILVASIGNLVVSVNRIDRVSAHKDQAIAYARETLETLAATANATFSCSSGACAGLCTPRPGYTSCWKPCTTAVCQPATQIVGTNPVFNRIVALTDQVGDTNIKHATVEVTWQDRGQTKSVRQETLLTGWKNL